MGKKRALVGLVVVLFVVAGGFVWLRREEPLGPPPAETKLALVHQSNRHGVLEPCGCSVNPYGGVEREYNALEKLRSEAGRQVVYLDAGNLFWKATDEQKGHLGHHVKRAETVVEILSEMSLDAFAPGPKDYALGLETLAALADEADFPFVSTNVVGPSGKPLFSPYAILKKGPLRIAVLSATPRLDVPGAKAQDVGGALERWLPEAKAKSHFVVLLSQLGTSEEQKLAERFPELRVIVGANDGYSGEKATWLAGGKALHVDTHNDGFLMGLVEMELRFPFKGFYSPEEVAENRRALAEIEAGRLGGDTKSDREAYLAKFKVLKSLEEIPGGTTYRAQLVRLDEQTYGRKNEVSKLVDRERERVRRAALGE